MICICICNCVLIILYLYLVLHFTWSYCAVQLTLHWWSVICFCICVVFVLYLYLYFNCGCIGPVNPPLGVHDRPRRMIHYDRRWLLMADCLIANDVVHTVLLIVISSMSVIVIVNCSYSELVILIIIDGISQLVRLLDQLADGFLSLVLWLKQKTKLSRIHCGLFV